MVVKQKLNSRIFQVRISANMERKQSFAEAAANSR
jgi:hypothetical protein